MKKLLTYFFIVLVSLVYNNQSLRFFVGNLTDYSISVADEQNDAEESPESEETKDVKLKYTDDYLLHHDLMLSQILEIYGDTYIFNHKDFTSDYNREVFYPPECIS